MGDSGNVAILLKGGDSGFHFQWIDFPDFGKNHIEKHIGLSRKYVNCSQVSAN